MVMKANNAAKSREESSKIGSFGILVKVPPVLAISA